ncbi:hypothetical protein H8B13_08590 [Hymenobacter sp. BT188]|uniref:hypothetical protein n=1 Tax=Hymenobacter sp. BT188 TaxID=2763504 RepID=UPI0016519C85|nr:hypothetical protein [Hymenobacter sp. BT188]MBC6606874.1 hypothetical protein [Hymenobacter sp. BT188]
MEEGFIYRFKSKYSKHPFVFIKNIDSETFIRCMITHTKNSSKYPQNIAMKNTHFASCLDNEESTEYKVSYERSNLVRLFLIKKHNQISSKPVGKLTDEGLQFLQSAVNTDSLVHWDNPQDWPKFD